MVSFQVTDRTFSLVLEGKDIAEIAELKAQLLETEVSALLEDAPDITLRAFRLPSVTRFLLTERQWQLCPPGDTAAGMGTLTFPGCSQPGTAADRKFLAFYVKNDQVLAAAGCQYAHGMAYIAELMRIGLMPPPAQLRSGKTDLFAHLRQ